MSQVWVCSGCGASVTLDGAPKSKGSCAADPGILGGHDWRFTGYAGGETAPEYDPDEPFFGPIFKVGFFTIVVTGLILDAMLVFLLEQDAVTIPTFMRFVKWVIGLVTGG